MCDIEIYQGDDATFALNITENKQPVDITGWKVYFTVKKHYADPDEDAIFKKDVIEHTDPTQGKTEISLTTEETSAAALGNYYYDVQIKDNSDKFQTLVSGRFRIQPQVTRRKNGS
jgi:hypothetical protein